MYGLDKKYEDWWVIVYAFKREKQHTIKTYWTFQIFIYNSYHSVPVWPFIYKSNVKKCGFFSSSMIQLFIDSFKTKFKQNLN